MKKKIFIPALLAASVLFSALAFAAREVTIFNAVSAASGSYVGFQGTASERTAGYTIIRYQACGVGFTGTVIAKQGSTAATIVTFETRTLTGVSDCTEYRTLNPSAFTGFSYTRSAGTLTLYMELAP